MTSDDFNLGLADSTEAVDAVNAKFYGRFPYPWAPMAFDSPMDPHFEMNMLNQSIGSWDHSVVPRSPTIWVAGCGTNQAVFTALRFPQARVLGSDLSTSSLEASEKSARQLGISNLKLKQQSINQTVHPDGFDYVICTGVIHHNADPQAALLKLAEALKPTGILELMVYNRYHRVMTIAFQKAIRTLGGRVGTAEVNFESELQIARGVIQGNKLNNTMAQLLELYKDCPEAMLADALLQPVEFHYTVESLEALAASCGLRFITPCLNQFDKAKQSFLWDMEFDDAALQSLYDSLPDSRRWQVSNHLMLEKSPMLWFYFEREDAGRERKTERGLCEEFLDRKFVKSETKKKVFVKTSAGDYAPGQRLPPYPGPHSDPLCRRILAEIAAQPTASMRGVLRRLELGENFSLVNRLRLMLTTSAFPYLTAVS